MQDQVSNMKRMHVPWKSQELLGILPTEQNEEHSVGSETTAQDEERLPEPKDMSYKLLKMNTRDEKTRNREQKIRELLGNYDMYLKGGHRQQFKQH